jgi:hypothetical protein
MGYGGAAYNRTVYAFLSCRTKWAGRRLGVQSPRSLRAHDSFAHIPARRNAAHCGGLECHIQPERLCKAG